ncbi:MULTISPECIES: hypothetical protein [unclassified Nostoc]|uniref:hypothetical protein n=1 Tax=unclassified Nostoc TaxID=2593658 RepID=UPI002AD25C1E|nr:hypothetical protein [Nostoc sp. DedQUE03]MDZ7971108.1 hypothetical protein [Nostoc sp. DedQUE03]MDZ8046736.1 hypothetical protein [Nostoc sp. DedQUE02]
MREIITNSYAAMPAAGYANAHKSAINLANLTKSGVAELKYEFGCRDVAVLRLYKDFGIMQNPTSYMESATPKIALLPAEKAKVNLYFSLAVQPEILRQTIVFVLNVYI